MQVNLSRKRRTILVVRQVISGEEAGAANLSGGRSYHRRRRSATVAVDIGGASTELVTPALARKPRRCLACRWAA